MAGDADVEPVPAAIRDAWAAERFKIDGRATVDLIARHLEAAHGRDDARVLPWREPAQAAAAWPVDYPEVGHGDLVGELSRAIAASLRLHHPRYMGHQVPPPLPGAALGELVAAILNQGMAVFEMGPAATPIEHAIVQWLAEQLGFGDGAGGVLTSGGSVGNLTALLAARQARRGDGAPVILVSTESHYSIARAIRIMGLGDSGAVAVAVDDKLRMDPRALDDAAATAIAAGTRPIAIVAAAGSTGCGAFDPLTEIAAVARARDLWLHVDAAHGAGVVLSRNHRGLLAGIELADSVVWDAHKLLMMPAMVTAVVFRDGRAGAAAFAQDAAYLFSDASAADEWWDIGLRTIECTKRMMALELHATLRAHGVGLFRDVVDRLIALGKALAVRVIAAPDFELMIEPEANIVCFRHAPAGVADRDAHNAALRARIVRDGRFYIVMTRSRGATWLRCALMNPLAEGRDLDDMLDHVRAMAGEPDVTRAF